MEHTAMRIRARAVRRCGELLKLVEKAINKHSTSVLAGTGRKQVEANAHRSKKGVGESPHLSERARVATEAGLSKDQRIDALRVANVNGEDFETQVDSDRPPTISNLAGQGKLKPNGIPAFEKLGMTKQAFQAGMYFRGDIKNYIYQRLPSLKNKCRNLPKTVDSLTISGYRVRE